MVSKSRYGDYWRDYPLLLAEAGALSGATLLIALVIFSRFWRLLANWIAMKS
jgi:hypothetical protein